MNKKIIILVVVLLIISVVAPIVINECYKSNTGYMTLWGAKEVLGYFGEIFGAVGSIFVGVIALRQSIRANEISDRLLALEEKRTIPFLKIDTENSIVNRIDNKEVNISIYFTNTTDVIVNILSVSDLVLDLKGSNEFSISFCKDWTEHYSILPNQSREMNFLREKKDSEQLIDISELYINDMFAQLRCGLILELGYVNSDEKYHQTFEFALMIPKDKNVPARFMYIENSIVKGDE